MNGTFVLVLMMLAEAAPASAQMVSAQLAYPPVALLAGAEGAVGYEVQVSKTGKVTGCKVTQTSHNADLDQQTCLQLRRAAQFKPALNSAGQPTKSTYAGRLRWSIPHPIPAAPTSSPRQP